MGSWRGRWRAAGFKEYSLAIASAAAGALLGAGVQNFADSTLRMMSTISVALCLGLVAVYASLAARDRETKAANQLLRDQVAQDGAAVISTIRQLEKQVGVQVRYQLAADIKRITSFKEDLLVQEVERAKSEILALDLLSETGRRPDTLRDDMLEPYYAILLQRAADNVVYRRVFQVEDPLVPLSYIQDTPFRRHCQEVCRVREESRNWNASIRVARRRYPYKFFIIDRKIVIVQLLCIGESAVVEEQIFYCDLAISDPGGDLVKVFLDMWNDVVEARDTRTLVWEEFSGGTELQQ